MDPRLYYTPEREGYLGISELGRAEVLFILREPNDNNNENKFWFKNDVYQPKIENKYYRLLSLLADILLHGKDSFHDKLGKCAYINLYPLSGESSVSKKYKDMTPQEICGRLTSCFKALKPRKIVCCMDIYDKIVSNFEEVKKLNGFTYKNTKKEKSFRACTIRANNEIIEVYEFYHPKARFAFDETNVIFKGEHHGEIL